MLRRLYDRVLALAGSRRAPAWLAVISFAESSLFPIPPDALLIPMCLARPQHAWRFALICTVSSVLGGALGNILDRARFGYVVDFADLHVATPWDADWRPFLVFNVADAAITVGVLVLLLRAFLTREPKQASVESPHA